MTIRKAVARRAICLTLLASILVTLSPAPPRYGGMPSTCSLRMA